MNSKLDLFALQLFCVVAVTVGVHYGPTINDRVGDPLGYHRCFADIVFALDSSGSVGEGNWTLVRRFVKAFAYKMHFGPDAQQLAVVSFGNSAKVNIGFKDYTTHAQLNASIDSDDVLPFLGEKTNTAEAFRVIREQVFTTAGGYRPDKPNVVIMLTDGKPNPDDGRAVPNANALKAMEHTYIFAIGIGKEGVNFQKLETLASSPSQTFVKRILSFSELDGLLEDIITKVCTVIEENCKNKDIVFVLDASGSVGKQNFGKIKSFVKRMMTNIPLGIDNNQVGVVSYSTSASTKILLDDFNDGEDFNKELDKMSHVNQRTNTSGAIRHAVVDVFHKQKQNRRDDDHCDVMLVISDGKDNTDEDLLMPEAAKAKKEGIKVVTVGVGHDSEMLRMEQMASHPAILHTFVLDTYDHLVAMGDKSHGDSIYDFICSPCKSNPYTEPELPECDRYSTFVLDSSSNVGLDNFRSIREQLASQLSSLDSTTLQRISVITFGQGDVGTVIELNTAQLVSRVNQLQYLGGTGDILDGLNRLTFYETGARPDNALNQVILVTASFRKFGDFPQVRNAVNNLITYGPSIGYRGQRFLIYSLALGSESEAKNLASMVATGAAGPDMDYGFVLRDRVADNGQFITAISQFGDFIHSIMERSCLDAAKELWVCTFENAIDQREMCGATQEFQQDTVDWTMSDKKTPSRHTGPNIAHTPPYYLFLEASGRKKGDHAMLHLPPRDISGYVCLHFFRHMLGHHTGSLQVLARDDDGHERIMWMKFGNEKRNEWLPTKAELYLDLGDYVSIRAVRWEGFSGDIAIDSLVLKEGPCYFHETMLSPFVLS